MDDVRVMVRVVECLTELTDPGSNLIRFEDPPLFFSSQVR